MHVCYPALKCISLWTSDGKSTLGGALLCECGVIDKRTIEAERKAAAEMGRASFTYANIFQKYSHRNSERERGISSHTPDEILPFCTGRCDTTFIDNSGFRDFIRETMFAASCFRSVDRAVLVVAAPAGEFEAAISLGGQMRPHLMLARFLGVRKVVIAVNKMEKLWSNRARYDEIVTETSVFLLKFGGFTVDGQPLDVQKLKGFIKSRVSWAPWTPLPTTDVSFVPISALLGQNIVQPLETDTCSWYQGPTLLSLIDSAANSPPPSTSQLDAHPLRMVVRDVFRISGKIIVPCLVLAGRLRVGQRLWVAPQGLAVMCVSIERKRQELDSANSGECGVHIEALPGEPALTLKSLKRGSVIGDAFHEPPQAVASVEALVFCTSGAKTLLGGEQETTLNSHCVNLRCKARPIALMTAKGMEPFAPLMKEEQRAIPTGGQLVALELTPLKPLCVEPAFFCGPLSRIVLRDMRSHIAFGTVLNVRYASAASATPPIVDSADEKRTLDGGQSHPPALSFGCPSFLEESGQRLNFVKDALSQFLVAPVVTLVWSYCVFFAADSGFQR